MRPGTPGNARRAWSNAGSGPIQLAVIVAASAVRIIDQIIRMVAMRYARAGTAREATVE